MVDIRKAFENSFNLLVKKKTLAVPLLLSVVVPMLLFTIFILMSGLHPLLKDLSSHYGDF